jgi:subtilase family serine protease
VPALGAGVSSGPVSTTVTVPGGLAAGTYYILAVADAMGAVAEGYETNNTKYLAVRVGPDLIVSALTGPATVSPGSSITIADTTKNQGLVAAAASVTKFYWSTNYTFEATDAALGSRAVPALGAGVSSGPESTTVTVPGDLAAGTYYVLAVADATKAVTEGYETNNTKYLAVKVGPDLVVSVLAGPAMVAPGASITIADTTKNQGLVAAGASVTRFYWSTNYTYEATDVALGSRAVPALAAGASSGPVSTTVTVPGSLTTGISYILAVADGTSAVLEASETNNTKYVRVTTGPDLVVSALTGPSTAAPGAPITISVTRPTGAPRRPGRR